MEASFEIALQIAKQKKPHIIGKTHIKPCIIRTVSLLFDESSAKKVQQVSASNDTVKRRILIMSTDVKEQIIQEIKASPFFAFQLDESTDVSSCSQLLVFVRYINSGDIKDEFLLCTKLETLSKSPDALQKLSLSSQAEGD